jgi:hypothetical protein
VALERIIFAVVGGQGNAAPPVPVLPAPETEDEPARKNGRRKATV